MKDQQLQTPRDQRRSKSTPDASKSLRKVAKKSLNPASEPTSEDKYIVSESIEKIPEVPDDINFDDADSENFIASINLADSHPSEPAAVLDLNFPWLQSFSIADKHVVVEDGEVVSNIPDVKYPSDCHLVEAEIVMKHLKEAKQNVLKSNDLGHSKKLLDSLIDTYVEGFTGGNSAERKRVDKLLSNNVLVFLNFMTVVLLFSILFFSSGDKETKYPGLKPT